MEKAIQTTLFYNPSKKEKKEFVNNCIELFNTFRRPKIVMPGYEDMLMPDDIKTQIVVERMILAKNDEKTASETEALWYLSTVSLAQPLDHSWYRIFMFLFRQWCIKTNKGLPDFTREQVTLEKYEEHDLKRLRDWLYRKSVEAL